MIRPDIMRISFFSRFILKKMIHWIDLIQNEKKVNQNTWHFFFNEILVCISYISNDPFLVKEIKSHPLYPSLLLRLSLTNMVRYESFILAFDKWQKEENASKEVKFLHVYMHQWFSSYRQQPPRHYQRKRKKRKRKKIPMK